MSDARLNTRAFTAPSYRSMEYVNYSASKTGHVASLSINNETMRE